MAFFVNASFFGFLFLSLVSQGLHAFRLTKLVSYKFGLTFETFHLPIFECRRHFILIIFFLIFYIRPSQNKNKNHSLIIHCCQYVEINILFADMFNSTSSECRLSQFADALHNRINPQRRLIVAVDSVGIHLMCIRLCMVLINIR